MVLKRFKLSRPGALGLLDDLEVSGGVTTTVYLPAGVTVEEASAHIERVAAAQAVAGKVTREVISSQTGAVLFWGSRCLLIQPPFPVRDKHLAAGCDVTPLRALLSRDWKIGLVLVRLGSYSIGVFEGERLLEHKTGTGLVHGRQRQGGSSSKRYVRRREEQTHHFLERVAEHARATLGPYAKSLDFLVYGGARTTILKLQKHGRFLEQFQNRLLPPLLTIPDPRFKVLEKAAMELWSSRVTEWEEAAPFGLTQPTPT